MSPAMLDCSAPPASEILACAEGADTLRPLTEGDIEAYCRMLHASFNAWYWKHGWGRDYFSCGPADARIFYDIYNDLAPGRSFAAFDPADGKMMGACFYHPREHHVSLGIMAVAPEYFGRGVGRRLVNAIVDFTDKNAYKALRLVSSAMNVDSFSLYNRSGLVPRVSYNDMILAVPAGGLKISVPGQDRVRDATPDDVSKMAALEHEISGISRAADYAYAIANKRGFLHAAVLENRAGGIDGFMISVQSPALNMLGPCVARTEDDALALVRRELDRFAGKVPLFLIPMEKRHMVETLYAWGARNVETHLFQARGVYKPFAGVNMPSFLPETG